MMRICLLSILLLLSACNGEMAKLSPISNVVSGDGIVPTVSGFIHSPNLQEDVQRIISLPYTGSDHASSCSVMALSNVLISRSCLCIEGFCSVGIRGTSHYSGAGSFQFSVTDPDGTSNTDIVNFSIDSIDDKPVGASSTLSLSEGATGTLTLNYSDVENDIATTCSVSDETHMTVGLCSCDLSGVCTVSVTGDAGYAGVGTLNFTVTANSLTSVARAASVTFSDVNNAPVINPVSDQTGVGNETFSFNITVDDDDRSSISCSSMTSSSSDTEVIPSSGITISGTIPTCTVSISPLNNAVGTSAITLEVSDGALSDTVTFSYTASGWGQFAYIKPNDNFSSNNFGTAFSLDGDTLAVGVPFKDSSKGGVYVYRRDVTGWVTEDFILDGSIEDGDQFGSSVYLSYDTLAIGAPFSDSSGTTITTNPVNDNSVLESGAVYLYTRSGVNWDLEAYFKAANAGGNDQFGKGLAIHRETLAVAAIGEDNDETAITSIQNTSGVGGDDNSALESGAVYIYTRSGTSWIQEAYIKADNSDAGDNFGYSLSLHGNLLAVGAPNESSSQTSITSAGSTDNSALNSGAVYIFSRSGNVWAQEIYLKAPNAENSDLFGFSVSLEGDKLAVGSPYEDSVKTGIASSSGVDDNTSSASGAAYVYKRTGSSWALESYIKPEHNDLSTFFGWSVSLKGETLIVGALGDNNLMQSITNSGVIPSGTTNSAGAAYVYKSAAGTWSREAYLKPTNLASMDKFGSGVAISGDTIAVSAPFEDGNQNTISNGTIATSVKDIPESGAVYIFQNNARLFDVTEVAVISSDTAINLTWHKTGGTATAYLIATNTGTTPPVTCSLMDPSTTTNTYSETGLLASSSYSFRICATNGSDITEGAIITVKTKAAGAAASAVVE